MVKTVNVAGNTLEVAHFTLESQEWLQIMQEFRESMRNHKKCTQNTCMHPFSITCAIFPLVGDGLAMGEVSGAMGGSVGP